MGCRTPPAAIVEGISRRGALLAKGAEEEGEEEGSRLFSNKFYLGSGRSGLGSSAITWREDSYASRCAIETWTL